MQKRPWARMAFGAYYAIMIYLLFLQRLDHAQLLWEQKAFYWQFIGENVNLVPFRSIVSYLGSTGGGANVNLAGNIVMFVPLGIFVPLRWENYRSFGKAMAACGAMILAVELVQLFSLCGSGDIDDLILNMIGAAIGYGLYAASKRFVAR